MLRFYEANKFLDVDYYSFRPLESTARSFYKSKQKKAQAREIVSSIEELSARDSRVTLNFKWNFIDSREDTCTAQWAQIAVNERGQVMYCCEKPYEIVGHVLDEDILLKKEKAKTNMNMCDIPCRMSAPNRFVAMAMRKRKDQYFI